MVVSRHAAARSAARLAGTASDLRSAYTFRERVSFSARSDGAGIRDAIPKTGDDPAIAAWVFCRGRPYIDGIKTMTQRSSHTNRLAAAGLSCAVTMGATLLATAPAAAQTAPAASPGCSIANMTPSSNATNGVAGAVGFACVADLDGNGTSEMVVGAIYDISGQGGYVLYITNTGAIRKKVCWGDGGCPVSP